MDPVRFDRFARRFARIPFSRRTALSGASLGLMGMIAGSTATHAQGTPTAGEAMAADDATLFVQTAAGGTFLPNTLATPDGTSHGTHLLTLSGHPGQTIGFSDRPQRNFGQLATPAFLEALIFTSDNPPNAALVVSSPDGTDDILVVELLNPSYDEDAGLLLYEANILGEYAGEVLAPVADRQQDHELASEFDHASLFIDDCPDLPIACRDGQCNQVGDVSNHGMCWNWDAFACQPCGGGWSGLVQACNSTYPAQCGGQCQDPTQCPGGQIL